MTTVMNITVVYVHTPSRELNSQLHTIMFQALRHMDVMHPHTCMIIMQKLHLEGELSGCQCYLQTMVAVQEITNVH